MPYSQYDPPPRPIDPEDEEEQDEQLAAFNAQFRGEQWARVKRGCQQRIEALQHVLELGQVETPEMALAMLQENRAQIKQLRAILADPAAFFMPRE